MGIQGLLPFLANSTRDAHISEFENQYVAVDAYCWLHKGIYCCSYELAMKKPTSKYVTYCLRFIEMLLHFKVKPILVFDGRNLLSKQETEKKRREERTRKYKKGLELIRAGKTAEGRQLLGESVDVTHELVIKLIKECREMNIDCIVSPFEADAQLSFFSLNKIVSCVITEDSDLLAYGCEKVMFKMDKSGKGRLIEKSNLYLSMGLEPEEFSEEKFRYMCILSGCDYLPSLPSIGPASALKFVKLIADKNILLALPRLPIYLNKMKVTVTPEYITGFQVADNTFKHQLVYEPFKRMQVPLRPVKNDNEIVGEKLPEDLAFQLAIGNIDPITMVTMDNFNPEQLNRGFDLLWRTKASGDMNMKSLINLDQSRTKKRQGEAALFGHDLKKYCLPQSKICNNNIQRKKLVNSLPQSGFVFEPTVEKTVTKPLEDSNFLHSRYFSSIAKVKREAKLKKSEKSDRRKDESYEEYLQRLYEEHDSGDEINEAQGSEQKDFLCSCIEKTCCECNFKNIDDNVLTKVPNKSKLKELRNLKKVEKENESFFFLDKFLAKEENLKVAPFSNEKMSSEEDCTDELPSIKSLCSELELSQNSEEENKKLGEINEIQPEEMVEVVINENVDANLRSPSPVFQVRKDNSLKKSFNNFGSNFDSTRSPTSIYFSSSFSESLDESPMNNEVKKSSRTSIQRITSIKNCRSVSSLKSGKISSKNSSCSRTLFQFGFKKD